MNDYWIQDDTIIFKPKFNGRLDNYIDIITKYDKLIFSDYDCPLICIETNNQVRIDKFNYYKINNFNNKINCLSSLSFIIINKLNFKLSSLYSYFNYNFYFKLLHTNLFSKLTYLFFNMSYRYNKLPYNLTHLTFGWDFNQNVDLPCNLTHLTFGNNFNQNVNLPCTLTHLTFGNDFNQNVDLPRNLTHLTFGNNFNQNVDLP